ncbi:MAG: methyltransferase domain-containing protein [Neisseriaceae bacterium]|nr:MAG: methyltransferase domain-containing protein [Neisseriaceae bacterium]
MNKIEYWLTKDSIGRDLFAQECEFLQKIVNRLSGNDHFLLGLGPVNIFQYINLYSLHTGIYVSESMPCDVVSSYTYLPFDENSVDILICHHVLEFSQAKDLLIRDISRILKPGGNLVVCSFNPHRLWLINPKWEGDTIFYKRNCMSIRQLREEIENNSMQVIEGQFMFYTPLFGSCFNSGRIDFLEKVGNRWWPNLSSIYALVAKKKVSKFITNPVGNKLLDTRHIGLVALTRKSDQLS